MPRQAHSLTMLSESLPVSWHCHRGDEQALASAQDSGKWQTVQLARVHRLKQQFRVRDSLPATSHVDSGDGRCVGALRHESWCGLPAFQGESGSPHGVARADDNPQSSLGAKLRKEVDIRIASASWGESTQNRLRVWGCELGARWQSYPFVANRCIRGAVPAHAHLGVEIH